MAEVYLKQNIQFEPLFYGWHAWFLTVPPVSAALNVAERYLPIMKSYVASPAMHASAARNPAMRGGPFIDLEGKRVDEIRDLIRETTDRSSALREFAHGLKQLWALLLERATGLTLEPIYQELPEILKGYVELFYDLNHNPSFRVFEALLYRSPFYAEAAQSVMLSVGDGCARRPFILSTPRLEDDRAVRLPIPFAHPVLDELFRMRGRSGSYARIADAMGVNGALEPLFRSFFTVEAPDPKPDRVFDADGFRIRYFGHACLLVQGRGVNIMIDPMVNCAFDGAMPSFTFADVPDRIDYVLITHSHHDHMVLETLLQLRHRVETVIVGRNCDGFPQDPSLELALRRLGFRNVIEVRDAEEITIPNGLIVAVPFLGEHNDIAIQSKNSWFVRVGSRSILVIADSCNLDPRLYDRVFGITGQPDILFLGMECEGAPLSWVYGPFFPKPLPREIDRSRRARGCNLEEAAALVDRFQFNRVCIYAMGQEPWVDHLLDNKFTEESPSLIQSLQFIDYCRAKGIEAESLFASKELIVR